jgi:DNA replication protein DnaC
MVDLLQQNLQRTTNPVPIPDTSKIADYFSGENCGFCYGLGYIESEGITAQIYEEAAFIEFKSRRGCLNCAKGLHFAAEWREHFGCDCDYGWTKETVIEKSPGGRMVELTVVSTCIKCKPGREMGGALEARIYTRKQARLNKLMANCGLSEEIASQTFDNFILTGDNESLSDAKRAVMAAAQTGRSIILMGNPGRGKTHLAAAYLNFWMQDRGKTGVFVSLVDLMASLRRTIRATEGPDWDTLLDRYIQAELLVLDDLGQEKASEKVIEVVFHLLNSRINQRKPTVVTTNYTLKLLAADAGYPPSICSRLASFERVTWEAPDYRLNRLKVVDLWDRPGA